jgi:hypothetical protein
LGVPIPYPYAKIDEDGWELENVEQADSINHPFLRNPIPEDVRRYATKLGDLVKLIFRYRENGDWDGQPVNAEHMWVRVTAFGEQCLVGELDSYPRFTKLLKVEDIIHFHPKHIVRFWDDVSPSESER